MAFDALDKTLKLDKSSYTRGLKSAAQSTMTFGTTTSGAFNDVGDEADTAARKAGRLAGRMGNLKREAVGAIPGLTLFGERVDEVGDKMSSTGRRARMSSMSIGAFAGSEGVAAGASVTLSSALSATLIPSLLTLATVLGPVAVGLGAVAAGAASLAAAFGTVIGTGFLAWGNKLAKQNKQKVKQKTKQIKKLKKLKKQQGKLSKQQQKRLKQLKKEKTELKGKTNAMGALAAKMKKVGGKMAKAIMPLGQKFIPLVRDAVNALPRLTKKIVKAIGPLDGFKRELRRLGGIAMQVIPDIVAGMFDLARTALPVFRKFINYIRSNGGPAMNLLQRTASKVWPELVSIGQSFVSLLPKILRFGNVVASSVLPVFDKLLKLANRAANMFFRLDKSTQKTVTTLAILAPAISPVLSILGLLASTIGGAALAASGLVGTVVSLAGSVAGLVPVISTVVPVIGLLASPLIGAAAAVTGLFLAIGTLALAAKTDMKTVKRTIRGAMKAGQKYLRQAAKAVMSIANGKFKKGFGTLGKVVRGVMKDIRVFLVGESGNGGAFRDIITSAVSFLKNDANKLLFAAADQAFKTLEAALKNAKIALIGKSGNGGIINSLIGGIATYLKSDAFKTLLSAAGRGIGEAIRTAAIDLHNAIVGKEPSLIGDMIGAIASYLKNDAYGDLKEAAKIAVDAIMAAFESLYNGLIGNSLIPEMLGDIVNFIRNWKIGRPFHHAMKRAKSTIEGFTNGFLNAGEGLIDAFVNGIRNKISEVKSAAGDVASAVDRYMPGSDADTGPLSNLTASGEALPATFAKGMERNLSPVVGASGAVAGAAAPSGGRGGSTTVVQLDGEATKQVLRGEAVEVYEREQDRQTNSIGRARNGSKR